MHIAIEIANSRLSWRAWLYLQTFPNIICSFSGPISKFIKARDETSINFNAFGADSQGRACGTLSPGIFSMFIQSDFQQQRKNWTMLQTTFIAKVSSYWKCLYLSAVCFRNRLCFSYLEGQSGRAGTNCCEAWQVSRAQEEAGSLEKA